MKIKAIGKKVILEKIAAPTMAGAIHIPEIDRQETFRRYRIVSIGAAAAQLHPELQEGQEVLANNYSADDKGLDRGLCCMNVDDVAMIV